MNKIDSLTKHNFTDFPLCKGKLTEEGNYEFQVPMLVISTHQQFYIVHKRRYHYFYYYGAAVEYTCGKKWNGHYNKLPLSRIKVMEYCVLYPLKEGDQYYNEIGELQVWRKG